MINTIKQIFTKTQPISTMVDYNTKSEAYNLRRRAAQNLLDNGTLLTTLTNAYLKSHPVNIAKSKAVSHMFRAIETYDLKTKKDC